MVTSLLSLFVLALAAAPICGKIIQLESHLKPKSLEDLVKRKWINRIQTRDLVKESVYKFEYPESGDSSQGRKPVGNKTMAIGTEGEILHDDVDKGFLSTLFRAYAHHWSLRTRPDDWWFTILRTIAIAVDRNSKDPKVQRFFVSHEGKKELVVTVPSLRETNFDWFFNQMTDQVSANINHPEYVDLAQPRFSTTTATHLTVANVAIMSSVQEYFKFTLNVACGIPRVDMLGSLQDWMELQRKFYSMKELLVSIREILMPESWWESVEGVLANLTETYQDNPDVKEWWYNVIEREGTCSGESFFTGWFMHNFLGEYQIEKAPLGIVTVPLTIAKGLRQEEAAVVAGIAGFNVQEESNSITWIEGNYVWGLMLDPDSKFRDELV